MSQANWTKLQIPYQGESEHLVLLAVSHNSVSLLTGCKVGEPVMTVPFAQNELMLICTEHIYIHLGLVRQLVRSKNFR